MAAVGSDLTAIGHIAGHKNATTTALYVHNSEAAARRAVARRTGILDTKVDTVAGHAGEMHPVAGLQAWPDSKRQQATSQGQKRQVGFEALCDGGSVAGSSRSALMCVSKHRRQRAASVRRIGSEMLLLVGHPGLEPGANGLRTQLMRANAPDFSTIPKVM